MRAVLAVAQYEFQIGVRNRWVVLASIILFVFALLLVLLGSAPTGATKADGLSVVVASLSTLTVYLVPLIALLLSYDAIAGEIDRGTLQLTLACPVSRSEVMLGKFLGHLLVLAIAISIGYGVAGGIGYYFGQNTGIAGLIDLGRLIATSIALGGTFIAIGYVASASVRQTGTAAALAVAIWLFAVVLYDLALLGALLVDPDGVFAKTVFPYLLLANPADAFRLFNLTTLDAGGSTGLTAGSGTMPVSTQLAILSPTIWTVTGLVVSCLILRRVQP
ncbi:MAG: ABC transporter permease subunit [Pseudomonadota bacterium]